METGHTEADLKYCVIVKSEKPPYNQIDKTKTLLCMEAYWMHTLHMMTPKGINQHMDFTGFFVNISLYRQLLSVL